MKLVLLLGRGCVANRLDLMGQTAVVAVLT
jgi:hypothetical protein